MRVGFGYDVHRLVVGRSLVLGGVKIPFEKGLDGHSDADVLSHAIGDALLGSVALGDLGRHFPDTDDRFRGVSSLTLLERISDFLGKRGVKVQNIDATVVAQRPRLVSFIPEMQRNIGRSLGIDPGQVSLKVTCPEGLGFIGGGEGISAFACTLVDNE